MLTGGIRPTAPPSRLQPLLNHGTLLGAAKDGFKDVLGLREVQDFEAKRNWPDLKSAAIRWEFVKDVVAMANGGGGSIVYGVATQPLLDEQGDVTAAIHLLGRAAVNFGMAQSILDQHALPRLRGVEMNFIEVPEDPSRGLVLLEVPQQPTKVILCKALEAGENLKEYLFGFVERDRDGTRNWTRDDVARMIRSGTDSVSARLEGIEQALGQLAQAHLASVRETDENNQLDARIEEMLRDD